MDWLKPENLQIVLATLAPGFIILFVRRQFSVFATQSTQDRIIAYAAISALYFALVNPLAQIIGLRAGSGLRSFLVYAFMPIVIGLIWAFVHSKDPLEPVWRKLGLRTLHNIPNAWDYAFGTVGPDTFVVATLRDGQQIAGKYGEGSFASTDASERDVLIGEVWEVDGDKWTKPSAPKSMLLCGRDIQLIEFFKPTETGEHDE